jgi:hypothetical protein
MPRHAMLSHLIGELPELLGRDLRLLQLIVFRLVQLHNPGADTCHPLETETPEAETIG